jgi:hypothetical protein
VINLLPSHDETLVLPVSAIEVFNRLSRVIGNDVSATQDRSILFSGWIKQDRFRISQKINRPNNYIALIRGKIEPTSSGCLVFIDYQLFSTTRLFLIFWLLFTCLFTAALSYIYSRIGYVIAGVSTAACMYWITRSNFRMQLKIVRTILLKVLES